MIIIIIRSLFIISNYFWQPKPLVVAKIYPALINGICWNRILNPTQSLANQVHFLVYTRFLFYHLDRYFEWRYVFSQQIRKYPSGRLLEFQPASQFCLVKMPQFHRWAAEELLARRRLMEEYSQPLVRWEEGPGLIPSQISITGVTRVKDVASSRVFCLSPPLMLRRVMADRKSHEVFRVDP